MANARFSDRTHYDPRPNALAEALARRRASRLPILDLTESNPTRAGFAHDPSLLEAALRVEGSERYEPEPFGLPAARAAAAAALVARGRAVDPSSVAITASTSEAYSFLLKILCDPGDEVLV